MGLDMTLYRKTYVRNWGVNKKTTIKIEGENTKHIDPEKISYITEEVMYWRKANQIHAWFVNNCNDGDDNNGNFDVSYEQLEELLKTCNAVLKASKLVKGKIGNGYIYENGKEKKVMVDGKYIEDPSVAKKLLPSTNGFFFGSTDYDEYYLSDVKETIKCLKRLLKETKQYEVDFEYSASW